MKPIAHKKPAKDQREKHILLGLVDLYLQTGKPVGSNTLRENGFASLSSATIRNYFSNLEEAGYLKQQHSSGGRIPTFQAYKLYAEAHRHSSTTGEKDKHLLRSKLIRETREIAGFLHHAADIISDTTHCAVFLSAPRFDQDFVLDLKLIGIDHSRCLCVLITDFGLVHTEVLYAEKKLSNFSLKRMEAYFHWRITGTSKPAAITEEEEALAARFYSEVMLRHIVGYTNFSYEDVYKTGFSKLLLYPDFNDAAALAGGLALFENPNSLRAILRECCQMNKLSCWIGDDLGSVASAASSCSVIAVPYHINHNVVGAIAILGPSRIPYRHLFGILQCAADSVSETLTKSLYKFKISFRQPNATFLSQTSCLLLEDQT